MRKISYGWIDRSVAILVAKKFVLEENETIQSACEIVINDQRFYRTTKRKGINQSSLPAFINDVQTALESQLKPKSKGEGMNVLKTLELLKKYEICKSCGNKYIGNGEGTLQIDDTFKRTCKCGWNIEVDENDEKVTI